MATEAVITPQQPIVEQAEQPNRLQKRFDRLVRTIKEQQEQIAKLKAENAELTQAVNRALDSRDLYCQRSKQRVALPPLTPNFHERTR